MATNNPFIGDSFFKNNPEKILGTQTTRKGQFGNDVIVVEGNLSNIEKINAQPVAVVDLLPTIVPTTATQQQQIEKIFDAEFAEIKDKKITQLRTGKKKSKADSPTDTQEVYSFAEIDAKYNANITQDEKEAYYFTHPEFNWKLLFPEFTNTKQDLIDKDLICFDDGKMVYVYTYKSGNVSQKISHLQRDKDKITAQFGEKQYDKQMAMLQSVKPKQKGFVGDEKITLLPHSNFAKQQRVKELRYLELSRDINLFGAFKIWLYRLPADEFKKATSREIIDYYLDNKSIPISKDSKEQKIKDEKNAINIRQRTKEEGDELFARFLANELLPEDQAKIAFLWNEKYNSIVEQDLTKVPVLFTMSKTFKNNLPLNISDTQRQAAAFNTEILSNGLAYGVGVGKTLASIVCFSQAYYSGFAKKPLFVVPTNTYDKWIGEIQGYHDKATGVFMHGALPQLPPVKGLFNLNPTIVRDELKDYTETDLQKLESIQLAIDALKKLKTPDVESSKRDVIAKIYPINWLGISEDHKLYLSESKSKNPSNFVEYTIDYLRDEYNYYIYELGTMKEFPDGTIFVTTEVGLQRLGVSYEDKNELQSKLYRILSQGENSAINERGGNDRAKEIAALELKIEQTISSSLKNAKINIDALGLDWVCFDEAHLYKKLFTFVKGSITGEKEDWKTGEKKNEREKSKYEIKSGSTPSSRALSAFVVSSYIQHKNNNRNVLMLTATPFTNSPLEVFSMLTLTNYKMLEDLGVDNMVDFFDTFMRIDYDIKLTAQKKVVKGVVLKGYNNLPQLRQIIYALWDKKDQGAGISRPNKIIYPSVEQKRETTLPMTQEQESLMRDVKSYIQGNNEFETICAAALQDEIDNMDFDGYDDEKLIDEWEQSTDREYNGERENLDDKERERLIEAIKKAANKLTGKELNEDELDESESAGVRILKGLSMMRQITLSPYLYYKACNKASGVVKELPNYKDYVQSSPKFLYAFGCIKSEMDYFTANGLKQSGKVMYMNAGVEYFPLLKEYAVKELGLKESQVGMVTGKMSKGAKENTKQAFLRGDILLLIGSSTISVGVDLQNNSTTLFNLYYDWNPTDAQQIEGRIWRQGNRFANVRIVYPQCYNSADPVIFEYLNSKTLRINEIWNRSSSVQELDLRDFNPKELQKKLITDPEEMAEWEMLEATDAIENQIIFFENRKETLVSAIDSFRQFVKLKPQVVEIMNIAASIKNSVTRKEAIANQKEKINKIVEEFGDDVEKMGSEITKYKASRYDYENDPSGKFAAIDFNELPDNEIYANAAKYIDLIGELNYRSGDEWEPIYRKSYEYERILKDFRANYKYMKAAEDKVLAPMGLTFTNAENPIEEFTAKMNDLKEQLTNIEASKTERIEQLKISMAASAGSIKTVTDRITEFAVDNEKYLLPQLNIPTKTDEVKKPQPHETVVSEADRKMEEIQKVNKSESQKGLAKTKDEFGINKMTDSVFKSRFLIFKKKYPTALFAFRLGDFYEFMGNDADIVSSVLGITLTKHNEVSLAGFPHTKLDGYLHKLVVAGHQVAIVEEQDDNNDFKPTRQEPTIEQYFEMPIANDLEQFDKNVDKILWSYTDRKAAFNKVAEYVGSNKEFGEKWLVLKGITNKEQGEIYLKNRQTKVRAKMIAEDKKQVRELKADIALENIERMVEQQTAKWDKLIAENQYNEMPLDDLISLKKQRYGNADIESAMSDDEKLLTKIIAQKFSAINAEIAEKRKAAKQDPKKMTAEGYDENNLDDMTHYKGDNEYQQRLRDFKIEKNANSKNYKKAIKFAKENGYYLKNDTSYNGFIHIEKLLQGNEDKIEIKVYDGIIKNEAPHVEVLTKEAVFGGKIMDETKYRFVRTSYHKQWNKDWYDLKDLDTAFKYAKDLEKNILEHNKNATTTNTKHQTVSTNESKENITKQVKALEIALKFADKEEKAKIEKQVKALNISLKFI